MARATPSSGGIGQRPGRRFARRRSALRNSPEMQTGAGDNAARAKAKHFAWRGWRHAAFRNRGRQQLQPARQKQPTAKAVAGDNLTLSNGLHWREYFVKNRPSSAAEYITKMFYVGMRQTDQFCLLDSSILTQRV